MFLIINNVQPTQTAINCANNSALKCYGVANVPFSVAGSHSVQKFFVVEELPRGVDVILGVRTMKSIDLSIALRKNCVFWKNIAVPFENIIMNATSVTKN